MKTAATRGTHNSNWFVLTASVFGRYRLPVCSPMHVDFGPRPRSFSPCCFCSKTNVSPYTKFVLIICSTTADQGPSARNVLNTYKNC